MISALDIRERAGEWGLSPDVVEKDYVLGWLLAAIGADPVLETILGRRPDGSAALCHRRIDEIAFLLDRRVDPVERATRVEFEVNEQFQCPTIRKQERLGAYRSMMRDIVTYGAQLAQAGSHVFRVQPRLARSGREQVPKVPAAVVVLNDPLESGKGNTFHERDPTPELDNWKRGFGSWVPLLHL